jgi:hypothetical protein
MSREIIITPVLNGFVCQVGCQRVVFGSTRELAVAVEEYYNHPEDTEKRFIEKAINKMEPQVVPQRENLREECCTSQPEQRQITGRAP